MRARQLLWGLLLGFSGCMVDLYGGNPRLQVAVGSRRWKLESVGLGDTSKPGWTEEFDPLVTYGGLTQVMDLPVAGDLNLFFRLRDTTGKDSVAQFLLKEDAGDFRKLEMWEDSTGSLGIR
jgi:hypothetical protein